MKSTIISFYRHLEMTAPFEQLPVELLESMIAANPVGARLTSRTLRQVAQRPFERRVCLRPVSTQDLARYRLVVSLYYDQESRQ
jgi:hypothetical protein